MRKYLSVFLAMLIAFSNLQTVSAKSTETSFLFYEAFDSFATNAKPDAALGSDKTRVTEVGTDNKALLLSAESYNASYNITGSFKSQFIIEMDVNLISHGVNAELITIGTSTTSMNLYKIEENYAKVSDVRPVNGISQNKFVRLSAKIDLKKCTYGIYIDGKCQVADYSLPVKLSEITNIKITVKPVEGRNSEVLIDNVRVYEGNILSSKKFAVPYNQETLVWPPETSDESDDDSFEIYMEDYEKSPVGTPLVSGGTVIAAKSDGTENFIIVNGDKENKYLQYHRAAGDPLVDFVSGSNNDEVIVEYTIKPISITSGARCTFTVLSQNNKGNFQAFYINSAGTIYNESTIIGKVNSGDWNRIIIVLRQDKREFDVILNSKKIASKLKFPGEEWGGLLKTRISATNSGTIDMYIDNVAAYKGNEPIKDLAAHFEKLKSSVKTKDETILEDCKDKIAYSITQDRAIVNGKLLRLSVLPIEYNGKYYIPEEIINAAEIQVSADAAVTIENNKYYLSDSIAEVLGYKTFSTENGFVLLAANADKAYEDYMYYYYIKEMVLYENPTAEEIYNDFKKKSENVHPRLILNEEDFKRMRGEVEFDPIKRELFEKLKVEAQRYLSAPNPTYTRPDGTRLNVHSTREPAIVSAFMYWMTGDMVYADNAKRLVLAAASMPDWNAMHHYLDVGVAGSYCAIVYDWLYDLFTEEERVIMEEGLTRNMLNSAFQGLYNDSWHTFPDKVYSEGGAGNWVAICMSGLILTATALMETNPEYCSMLIADGLGNFRKLLPGFEPDGAWEEGNSYWGYASTFYMYIIETLESAMGTEYEMFYSVPAIDKTAYYPYDIATPTGIFAFGDCDEFTGSGNNLVVGWYASQLNNPDLYSLRYNELKTGSTISLYDVLYLDSANVNKNPELPLDRYYRKVDVGSMRSEFFNKNASYVGYLADPSTSGHGHYDAGNFIFDALGVRWATDLGLDDYSLYGEGGQTQKVYRLRPEGHNVYVINPDEYVGQAEDNKNDGAERYESNENSSYVVLDLSETYSEDAVSAKRGLKLGDLRNTLLIRDEIEVKKENSDFYWFMHTRAKVTVDGNVAYLTQKGQTLKFELLSNQPLTLGTMAAEPLPTTPLISGQNANAGVTKIVINGKVTGKLNLTVKMTPVIDGIEFSPISDIPLDNWTLDAPVQMGKKPLLTDLKIEGKTVSGFDPSVRNYNYLYASATGKLNVTPSADEAYNTKITSVDTEDGTIYQILITEKSNPSNYGLYTLDTKLIKNAHISVDEKFAMPYKFYASAEPQAANSAANILDGDLTTRWSAQGENNMIYEFEEPVIVSAVDMATHEGRARKQYFSIHVSMDGVNYTELLNTETSGKTTGLERYELEDVTAKYVKLNCTKTTVGDWNSVTEFYVYTK